MEEKPVSATSRTPLILGILAFLTSFPLWLLVMMIIPWNGGGNDFFYWYFFGFAGLFLNPISLVLGLEALIAGIKNRRRTEGKNGYAIPGIVLGVFAILGELVYYIYITTFGSWIYR